MIMIKAPIELKVRSDLMHGYDAFGERIAGNYSLIGLEIGEEELLHMVNSPPEIYLADTGSTTIGGNTFISSRNEEKYNIVNNMLNRILLSVDGELTYQDRTYITDALHKLGIKDDRKFMNEVRNLIEESRLEENFLNHYFELVMEGENRELRQQTLELTKELTERDSYNTERMREDRLSERILHRLRTGAIYQIVSNFNRSLSDTRIELQESMLSEQDNVARKLLVQNFVSSIVREEPELFYRVEGSADAGGVETQIIREVPAGTAERPGETVREERRTITERSDREIRESEQVYTDRETALHTEHETAEIVYRQEGEPGTLSSEVPSATEERVIREEGRTPEPGRTEYRTTERIRTEPEQIAPAVGREAETGIPAAGERVITEAGAVERLTERITEGGTSVTERQDRELSTERTERYVTEQGEVLRTEHDQSELVYREGETKEIYDQSALERLRERLTEERDRVTERRDIERLRTDQTLTRQEAEILRDRLTREQILRQERERLLQGEMIPGREAERVTVEGAGVTERTERERFTERTERYVTEPGEILRTEHEGAEIVYREEKAAAGPGEIIPQSLETVHETGIIESERVREPGETVITEQRIPGQPGEHVTESRRVTERLDTEYRTTESRITEQGPKVQTDRERTEVLREKGGDSTVLQEMLREESWEQIISDRTEATERTEAERITERTDRYVTEAGEILRTEHEGAELIYREGAAAEAEGGETETRETIRETSESERERISERERLEKERSSFRSEEERIASVRSELREQMERERIRTEQLVAGQDQETGAVLSEAELIYREEASAEGAQAGEAAARETIREIRETDRMSERERLERERSTSERKEEVISNVRDELREQLRTERIRTEQVSAGEAPAAERVYESPELVYRRESAAAGEESAVQQPAGSTREIRQFRSDNIYERELLEKERSRTEVTSELAAAVLLDVVKTLFHAGYEKIGKGDTWIEYRGAIYHSADNIFNRLNVNLEEGTYTQVSSYPEYSEEVNLEQVDYSELQEISENTQDVQQIENTIRQMNEMNLQNVERYQQMVQVLKEMRPEKRRTGGKERTRQEALDLLDDEQALYETLRSSENEQEDQRREVFHEITRLFPDRSVEIFRILEQYLEGKESPDRANVMRNNVEAAAEEIRRITAAAPVVAEPVMETAETESSELIFRRNDRVTQEEVEEMVENLRRSEQLQRREIEQRREQVETERRNTYSMTTNRERTLSRQEAEDIEALVSRGVRAQMGAISEQVLQKLEKKLKNEKIRRGI